MPIQVTCPKCLKRFQVSDQFAGKSGPCPNCKEQIKVPDKSEEVVIHAPEDGSPKDRAGESILKPIERTETDVTRKGMLITGGAVLLAIALAVGLRVTGGAPLIVQILAVLLLAPPLVWAGYSFVRDSELEPYRGDELRNRVLILSGILALTWVIYAFVPAYVMDLEGPSEMSWLVFGVVFCVMLAAGAIGSAATFELEFTSGLAHAGLYLITMLLLAAISGITLAGAPTEDDRLIEEEEEEEARVIEVQQNPYVMVSPGVLTSQPWDGNPLAFEPRVSRSTRNVNLAT